MILHYGRPAEGVGCADTKGRPLWDGQYERVAAWVDAQTAVAEYDSAALKFLFLCAERAQDVYSHKELDKLENFLLGEVVTGGTFPKRQRFWRFINYIARGITPRDLRDI